jgi:predicted amidohydrolase
MKVVMLQTDISWAKPEENIRHAQQLMDEMPDGDLYVLPEMWSTGFVTQPEGIASDEVNDKALSWMCQTAQERKCAISGSLAVKASDGTFRNRHYFMDGRAGETYYYDKHHLFTYGGENSYYTPGQQHTIVNYMGFRLLLQTCYDLRFPCWSRYADNLEYDAIICVANWPSSRQSAWQLLIRARAIENQCYMIGVNRVGDDQRCHYIGASAVIDVTGRTVAQCRRGNPQALMCDIQMEELRRRREKFRVLDDRD